MCSVNCAVQNVMSAQQDALQQKISISVAAKQLDVVEQQGEAMNAVLEAAAQMGKAIGRGDRFDSQA